jgi:hypothetical protein
VVQTKDVSIISVSPIDPDAAPIPSVPDVRSVTVVNASSLSRPGVKQTRTVDRMKSVKREGVARGIVEIMPIALGGKFARMVDVSSRPIRAG